jgi:1-acyl-sn-glycerol-3-phosphate acyltransferase
MNKKKHKRTLWGFFLTALFAIIFVVVVIFIIPFVIVNDLVFDPVKGWNSNYKIFAHAFRFCYFFLGIQNKQYYEYDHDPAKKYVFVLNHISFFDIPEMLIGIKQPIRILAKRGPDKIPVFGYYYRKSTVMVDRSNNESRLKSLLLLRKYLDQGVSILICPEGTFNMTNKPLKEFYDGAFKIAIDTQTNIKPVVILDTFDRLHYDYNLIDNGISRIVYLEEVSVQGLTGEEVQLLKEKVYKIMEDALIRYRASWIDRVYLTN